MSDEPQWVNFPVIYIEERREEWLQLQEVHQLCLARLRVQAEEMRRHYIRSAIGFGVAGLGFGFALGITVSRIFG